MNASREIGYSTILSRSMGFAWRMKPFWLLGALLSYGHGILIIALLEDGAEIMELLDISGPVILGLALPALLVGLAVFHAAADGGVITAGVAWATGGNVTLGQAWRRGRERTVAVLGAWIALWLVLFAWAGLTAGIPVVLGIVVHPLVGIGFGLLGLTLFAITFLFVFPLGMYAVRSIVVNRSPFTAAWQEGLNLVRAEPARTAGIALVGSLYTFGVGAMETLAGGILSAIWRFLVATLPTPFAVGIGVLLSIPLFVAVHGCLASAVSHYWSLAYLWARQARREES